MSSVLSFAIGVLSMLIVLALGGPWYVGLLVGALITVIIAAIGEARS